MTAYAELCVTSNFSFLRGASHPEELVTRAAELGLSAIAITDRNSVAGVVRAFSALKELIWHALLHKVQAPMVSPLLVVTRPTIAPLQTSQRKQAEAMCQLIGAEFQSIVRVAVAKPNPKG